MNAYFAWFGLPGSLVLTVLLSLFALVMALVQPSSARWFCFAAMAVSSAGDIFLMRLNGLDRIFPNYFTIGAACFMAAHLLYFNTYRIMISSRGYGFLNAGAAAAALIAIVCAVGFTILCARRHNFSQYPLALIYLCVISAASAMIFSYSFSAGRTHPFAWLAAVGSLSFLVSDLIIGLGMLGGIKRFDHLIWWFYPIGQFLIILSAK